MLRASQPSTERIFNKELVATIQAIRMFRNLQHSYKNLQNLQHSNYRGIL